MEDSPPSEASSWRPCIPTREGSRAVHAGVKSSLFITQDLVKGATAAGCLWGPVDQSGRQYRESHRGDRPGFAGRGYDRPGSREHQPDHTQGRLVQVGRQHVLGSQPRQCPEQSESHRMVPPVRLGGRLEERFSSVAHHSQVVPSASNCSPISRLAVRIEEGMIEASARRFSACRSAGRPARAPRQPEATSMPSSGPSEVRSHRRVQRSRLSAS